MLLCVQCVYVYIMHKMIHKNENTCKLCLCCLLMCRECPCTQKILILGYICIVEIPSNVQNVKTRCHSYEQIAHANTPLNIEGMLFWYIRLEQTKILYTDTPATNYSHLYYTVLFLIHYIWSSLTPKFHWVTTVPTASPFTYPSICNVP